MPIRTAVPITIGAEVSFSLPGEKEGELSRHASYRVDEISFQDPLSLPHEIYEFINPGPELVREKVREKKEVPLLLAIISGKMLYYYARTKDSGGTYGTTNL